MLDYTSTCPAFYRLRNAESVYVYHYTLAFKSDVLLERHSTEILNDLRCTYQWRFYGFSNSRLFVPKSTAAALG